MDDEHIFFPLKLAGDDYTLWYIDVSEEDYDWTSPDYDNNLLSTFLTRLQNYCQGRSINRTGCLFTFQSEKEGENFDKFDESAFSSSLALYLSGVKETYHRCIKQEWASVTATACLKFEDSGSGKGIIPLLEEPEDIEKKFMGFLDRIALLPIQDNRAHLFLYYSETVEESDLKLLLTPDCPVEVRGLDNRHDLMKAGRIVFTSNIGREPSYGKGSDQDHLFQIFKRNYGKGLRDHDRIYYDSQLIETQNFDKLEDQFDIRPAASILLHGQGAVGKSTLAFSFTRKLMIQDEIFSALWLTIGKKEEKEIEKLESLTASREDHEQRLDYIDKKLREIFKINEINEELIRRRTGVVNTAGLDTGQKYLIIVDNLEMNTDLLEWFLLQSQHYFRREFSRSGIIYTSRSETGKYIEKAMKVEPFEKDAVRAYVKSRIKRTPQKGMDYLKNLNGKNAELYFDTWIKITGGSPGRIDLLFNSLGAKYSISDLYMYRWSNNGSFDEILYSNILKNKIIRNHIKALFYLLKYGDRDRIDFSVLLKRKVDFNFGTDEAVKEYLYELERRYIIEIHEDSFSWDSMAYFAFLLGHRFEHFRHKYTDPVFMLFEYIRLDQRDPLLRIKKLIDKSQVLSWIPGRKPDYSILQKTQSGGWSVLHQAARYNSNEALIDFLLEPKTGLNPHVQNNIGFKPIQNAARKSKSLAVVEALWDGTYGNSDVPEIAYSLTAQAIIKNVNPEIVDFFLCKLTDRDIGKIEKNQARTLLHLVSLYSQQKDVLMQILDRNWYPVDVRDSKGRTPLHLALSWNPDYSIAATLITEGASFKITEHVDGCSPVLFALWNSRFPVHIKKAIDALDDNYEAINENGHTVLHSILHNQYCSAEEVKQIIVIFTSYINHQDKQGNTPLHIYTSNRKPDTEVLRLLLDYGADPSIRTFVQKQKNRKVGGVTPYHLASRNWSDTDCLKLLFGKLKGSVDEVVNANSWSPLHYAAVGDADLDLFRQLIEEKGSDLSKKMYDDLLHLLAIHTSKSNVIDYFFKKFQELGIIPAERRKKDNYPVHGCAKNKDLSIIKYFLGKLKDPDTGTVKYLKVSENPEYYEDKEIWSVLRCALRNNENSDIIDYFLYCFTPEELAAEIEHNSYIVVDAVKNVEWRQFEQLLNVDENLIRLKPSGYPLLLTAGMYCSKPSMINGLFSFASERRIRLETSSSKGMHLLEYTERFGKSDVVKDFIRTHEKQIRRYEKENIWEISEYSEIKACKSPKG